jgi:hypothetical protein
LILASASRLRAPAAVKLLGFCALMVLAALNKWRFGPALRRGDVAAGRRFR